MEENGKLLSLYYEGKDLRALEEDFHDAIDFYLENCADEGREPERAKGIIRMHYLE